MSPGLGFSVTNARGFHMNFPNGWTVSVQFGAGTYSAHHDCGIFPPECQHDAKRPCGENGSWNAEVATWGPDGKMLDLGGDTVRGWQTPAAVLALLNAAANGDLAAGKIPPEERSS